MNPTSRLVLVGLVIAASLLGLWPTFQLYQVNQERNRHKGNPTALARWDSLNAGRVRQIQEGNFFTRPIKLGLDLQGGMYITMEVDVPTLLRESAQPDAVDETFEQVIAETRKEAATSDEAVIDIFSRKFDELARPKGKTLLNYYDFGTLGADATDETVRQKLMQNIEDAVDQAAEVVRRRIDPEGVGETNIQKQAGRRIVVELPGITDREQVRTLLQTTARLEFKLVKNNAETARLFKKIDEVLAGKVSTADTTAPAKGDSGTAAKGDSGTAAKGDSGTAAKGDSNTAAKGDSAKGDTNIAKNDTAGADTSDPYAGLPDEEKARRYRADHPFTTLFETLARMGDENQPQQFSGVYAGNDFPDAEYDFIITKANIKKLKQLLNRPDVRAILPEDMVIAFSADETYPNPDDPENAGYSFYVVPKESELTGEVISDAMPSFDQMGQPMVMMEMNTDGADQWANITGRNIKKRVAIILDSAVYSAPTVQNKIPNGSSQITGAKNAEEAQLLATVLKAGALKAPVRIIEERLVGPSLGEDSISKGFWSTVIATILVFLFMIVYYRMGGVVADLALLMNILITMAILAAFNATLTLPGIGGLVLTIGMAVDGNILIYERIREELAMGKSLKTAIQQGYDKAWSAVLDTHITTLISGAILYFFGSGPIRGFAVTLIIGLTATLFTAVFVTRTIFILMIERGATTIDFGQPKSAPAPTTRPELA